MFEEYDLTKFGLKLKEIRKLHNYSQSYVSTNAKVHEDTLRRLENGKVVPRINTLFLLGKFYKVNLFNYVYSEKINLSILDIYHELDTLIIYHLDSSYKFQELYDELRALDFDNLFNKRDAELLGIFISLLGKLRDWNEYSDYESIIKDIRIEIFRCKLGDIGKEGFKGNYSPIEIRILLLYSLALVNIEEYNESNKVIKEIIDYILVTDDGELERKKILVKLYYNLAYNYHLQERHTEALEVTNTCIEFISESDINYCVEYVLARRGIAKYYLNDSDYTKDFYKSISCLVIKNQFETAKSFRKIFKDVCNFEIADDFLSKITYISELY